MVRGLRIRRRTVLVEVAALAVVAALIGGAILVPAALRSGPDRYDDGIPRTWQGQPVLRGQAALDFAKADTDTTPFLVAFWTDYPDLMNCNAQPQFDNDCEGMGDIGDEPGVPFGTLGAALHMLPTHIGTVTPGPMIVRAHTHDPKALACTTDRLASCAAVMVIDEILWTGDQATAAHPITVSQVVAAFGGVTGLTFPSNMFVGDLPGAPQVFFPGPGPWFEGAAAVFPSAETLAAAFPDVAAHGESDSFPVNSILDGLTGGGSDPNRGPGVFTFKYHWLARGNVLVGIRYDASLGPDMDPYVKMARANLAKLPEG
jgi:hypothetical protein